MIEGVDFIIEDGRYVFTSGYLAKRGYCCGSGCRNCPYRRSAVEVWVIYHRHLTGPNAPDQIFMPDGRPWIFVTRDEADSACQKLAGPHKMIWPTQVPERFTDEFQSVWKFAVSFVYWGVAVTVGGADGASN